MVGMTTVTAKGISAADPENHVDETGSVVEDDLPEGVLIGEIEEFEAGTDRLVRHSG